MAVTFLQSASSNTAGTSFTMAAQDLGTAQADRHIIITISTRRAGTPLTISGVTVDGIAASEVVQRSSGGSNINVAGIFIAAVPTGTSGDVVVTMSASSVRIGIGMYHSVGMTNPTAYATNSNVGANPTATLDIPADGFGLGVIICGSTGTTTWTGLTEDYDITVGTSSFINASGASATFGTLQTGLSITGDPTGTTDPAGAFASWAPAAASITVTPDTLSLTTTSYAPTIQLPQVVTAGLLSLAIATFAPTVAVSNNQSVTPATASLTSSLFAPTVAVTNHQVVTPDTASLAVTTFDPLVTASDNQSVTPATVSLTTSTFAPTIAILVGIYVDPTPASLSLTTYAPIVNYSVPARKYFIDADGEVYWIINQTLGLVEKI